MLSEQHHNIGREGSPFLLCKHMNGWKERTIIFFDVILGVLMGLTPFYGWRTSQMLSELLHIHCPKLAFKPGMTHTSELTLEYMAPLSTSPLRIQMMDAAGLALSAWQVRLRGSPARRLTTGPPLMTGFSGGTETRREDTSLESYSGTCVGRATIFSQDDVGLFLKMQLPLFVPTIHDTCSSLLTLFKRGEHKWARSVVIFWGFFSFFFYKLQPLTFNVLDFVFPLLLLVHFSCATVLHGICWTQKSDIEIFPGGWISH